MFQHFFLWLTPWGSWPTQRIPNDILEGNSQIQIEAPFRLFAYLSVNKYVHSQILGTFNVTWYGNDTLVFLYWSPSIDMFILLHKCGFQTMDEYDVFLTLAFTPKLTHSKVQLASLLFQQLNLHWTHLLGYTIFYLLVEQEVALVVFWTIWWFRHALHIFRFWKTVKNIKNFLSTLRGRRIAPPVLSNSGYSWTPKPTLVHLNFFKFSSVFKISIFSLCCQKKIA